MKQTDLTRGPLLPGLMRYFLPIAAGTLFQQLYNAVDAIIVSKYVGTSALAAVGGTPAVLISLLLGFFIALSGGAGVVIAMHFGAGESDKVCREIHTSITFCALIGVLLSVIVILPAPQILRWMATPAETLEDAVVYTRIYFAGSIFMLLFNMGSGILRALGNSRLPFVCLFVSCGVNVVLDIWFVCGLGWGVAGAAWATVIAQGVSTVCVLFPLFRADPSIRLHPKKLGIDLPVLSGMLKIGVPSGIQSAMYGVSNLILQIGVNLLGEVVVASWAMCGKVDGVYWAVAGAFGTAVVNFVGQNYGAGKTGRIRECSKKSMLLFGALTAVFSVAIMLAARPLLAIFTDDPAVVETTMTLLSYFVPYYILWTAIEVLSGVLRGVGDAVMPMVILAIGVCLFRVVWLLAVFLPDRTLLSLSACYPISWFLAGAALIFYYFAASAFRRGKAVQED